MRNGRYYLLPGEKEIKGLSLLLLSLLNLSLDLSLGPISIVSLSLRFGYLNSKPTALVVPGGSAPSSANRFN